MFHTGYYVSKRLPYPTLQQLDREPQARQFEILDAFAAFTVRLHEKGVLDYDYNPGNIFYYREDGAWNFALIDVNRMAFRRNLSRRDCVEMLHHLDWETPYLDYVLIRYAELRRWDWKLLSGAVLLKQGINLPVRIRRSHSSITSRPSRRRCAWPPVLRQTAWRPRAWPSRSVSTRDFAQLLPRSQTA